MMVMDGSADQGLIVHEVGHNYAMGLLANNEWREGWLDEGLTSFQTTWFWEASGKPSTYPETEAAVLFGDLDGWSEPPSLAGEAYRDFNSYQEAIYTRGELFFHQLRHQVGDERCTASSGRSTTAGATARGRGGVSRRGRRGVEAGPLGALRPVAAHHRALRLRDRQGEAAAARRGLGDADRGRCARRRGSTRWTWRSWRRGIPR